MRPGQTIEVVLGEHWTAYSEYAPPGYYFIGTVIRDGFDTGALAVAESDTDSPFGHYCQVNANAVRLLPQMNTYCAIVRAHQTEYRSIVSAHQKKRRHQWN